MNKSYALVSAILFGLVARSQVTGRRSQDPDIIIISCSARGRNKKILYCSKTVLLIYDFPVVINNLFLIVVYSI